MKQLNTLVFIVEDDPMYQKMVKYIMELNPDHEVRVFSKGRDCLKHLDEKPAIVSLDYSLPDMEGAEVLKKIKTHDPNIGVIVLSGQQDVATAVNLLKEGADDYVIKDNETKDRLLLSVNKIKEKQSLVNQVNQLKQQLDQRGEFRKNIIGNSRPMEYVFSLIEKAVKTDITVSITGETGTGKEVVAKAIHQNSSRRKGPFVAINMSAIPSELLESELFGYEKGAFTGAQSQKKGQFELADGGTLFLDEITELDMSMQAKLLRALQEREFMRVGGSKPIAFNVRIITASHKDMAEEVAKGNFREDLYYRLLGLSIELPPLRDRGNDVLLLAQHFLNEFTKANGMERMSFSEEARQKLLDYPFPGNVRELKAVVDLAAVMASGPSIMPEDIRFNSARSKEENFLHEELTLEEYKERIIRHYLGKYNNDVLFVAKKLGIGKSTIYRMLKEKDLRRSASVYA
ncbi:MAG: regulator [Saprospirales bacterium]|nr:regulator [Saprospirales bacterium]